MLAFWGAAAAANAPSFVLPTYTGSSSIFGDATKGYIELYTSGDLTLSPFTYDVHLVGGGASGGGGRITIGGTQYTGLANPGSATTGFGFTANGGANGQTNQYRLGTNGGSGGGGSGGNSSTYKAGAGGSDGANGAQGRKSSSTTRNGGTGQGTTTRDFGDNAFTLRSGGGGGGGTGQNARGAGGSGGGGYGGYGTSTYKAVAGTANTGGGGGGGSVSSSMTDSGGGGGGGYTTTKLAQSLNGTYTITIGAGGAGVGYSTYTNVGAAGGSGIVVVRWGY